MLKTLNEESEIKNLGVVVKKYIDNYDIMLRICNTKFGNLVYNIACTQYINSSTVKMLVKERRDAEYAVDLKMTKDELLEVIGGVDTLSLEVMTKYVKEYGSEWFIDMFLKNSRRPVVECCILDAIDRKLPQDFILQLVHQSNAEIALPHVILKLPEYTTLMEILSLLYPYNKKNPRKYRVDCITNAFTVKLKESRCLSNLKIYNKETKEFVGSTPGKFSYVIHKEVLIPCEFVEKIYASRKSVGFMFYYRNKPKLIISIGERFFIENESEIITALDICENYGISVLCYANEQMGERWELLPSKGSLAPTPEYLIDDKYDYLVKIIRGEK